MQIMTKLERFVEMMSFTEGRKNTSLYFFRISLSLFQTSLWSILSLRSAPIRHVKHKI